MVSFEAEIQGKHHSHKSHEQDGVWQPVSTEPLLDSDDEFQPLIMPKRLSKHKGKQKRGSVVKQQQQQQQQQQQEEEDHQQEEEVIIKKEASPTEEHCVEIENVSEWIHQPTTTTDDISPLFDLMDTHIDYDRWSDMNESINDGSEEHMEENYIDELMENHYSEELIEEDSIEEDSIEEDSIEGLQEDHITGESTNNSTIDELEQYNDIVELLEDNNTTHLDISIECPLCFNMFHEDIIETHASECTGQTPPSHTSSTPSLPTSQVACPLCGCIVDKNTLEEHVEAELLGSTQDQLLPKNSLHTSTAALSRPSSYTAEITSPLEGFTHLLENRHRPRCARYLAQFQPATPQPDIVMAEEEPTEVRVDRETLQAHPHSSWEPLSPLQGFVHLLEHRHRPDCARYFEQFKLPVQRSRLATAQQRKRRASRPTRGSYAKKGRSFRRTHKANE